MDENIIYLLIGIVYLIYKAWGSIKPSKKPAQYQPDRDRDEEYTQPEPPQSNIETILETILKGEIPEQEPTYSSPYQVENFEEYTPNPAYEKKLQELKNQKPSSLDSISSIEGVSMIEDEIDEIQFEEQEELSDFELRQAVIFSEILRRPYA